MSDLEDYFFAGLLLLLFAGCVGLLAIPDQAPNRDPRADWVRVSDDGTRKKCDGTTLVYRGGRGVSVVPNSEECKP